MNAKPHGAQCSACIYWQKIGDNKIGHCRLGPPSIFATTDHTGDNPRTGYVTAWPETTASEWCGEYADIWETDEHDPDAADPNDTIAGEFPPFPPAP